MNRLLSVATALALGCNLGAGTLSLGALDTGDSVEDTDTDEVEVQVEDSADGSETASELPAVNLCDGKVCDDENACTADLCRPSDGVCLNPPLTGAPCDDGDACTAGDACSESGCSGIAITCDDASVCTVDACDPVTGCDNAPIGGPCDDHDACTLEDQCTEGVCAAGPVRDCSDGQPCTADACVAGTGACDNHILVLGQCDDGSACTVGDACDAEGVCDGIPIACIDGDPCTADTCDPLTGCQNESVDGPCSDGNACTLGDSCKGGSCVAGPPEVCDDKNACTGDFCDTPTGACQFPVLIGAACDDGTACTTGDKCSPEAKCGGLPVGCEEGNPCTIDTCDPFTGCGHSFAEGQPCDDGNACTTGDLCTEGICAGGGVGCQCQANSDCAVFENGDRCDGLLVCVGTSCVVDPATVVVCDPTPTAPCAIPTCVPTTGGCTTKDVVDGSACNDGNACVHSSTCAAGKCSGTSVVCDDGNPCTTDTCVPGSGCSFTPQALPCDDGDDCTDGDTCAAGACVPGTDLCECHGPADCAPLENGDRCDGTLTCVAFQCQVDPSTVVICNPTGDTPCAKSTCAPASGLCVKVSAPAGTTCNDGDACTDDDRCASGTCIGLDAVECVDGDTCTADVCEPATGCKYLHLNGFSCSDGDGCTGPDTCVAGVCAGPNACDDGNTCTKDSCLGGGCVAVPIQDGTTPCDDGMPCTTSDVCAPTGCVGVVKTCDDKEVCTRDSCAPATGVCTNSPLPGDVCSDGNPCTPKDVCGADGKCAGSGTCDDNNPCTADTCSPSGCGHGPLCGDRSLPKPLALRPPMMTRIGTSHLAVVWPAAGASGVEIATSTFTANGAFLAAPSLKTPGATLGAGTAATGSIRVGATVVGFWVAHSRSVPGTGGDGSADIVLDGFDPAGVSAGSTQVINTTTAGSQDQPTGAALTSSLLLLAWTSRTQDGLSSRIVGRFVNGTTGQGLSTEFPLGPSVLTAREARVAAAPSGAFVVTAVGEALSGATTGGDISVQWASGTASSNGPAKTGAADVACGASCAGEQGVPAVAVAAASDIALVVWQSKGLNADVLGRFVSHDAAFASVFGSPEFDLADLTTGDQVAPAVEAWHDGFVVAWQDPARGVVLRGVSALGLLGPEQVVSTSTLSLSAAAGPTLVTTPNSHRIMVAFAGASGSVTLAGFCSPPPAVENCGSDACVRDQCMALECIDNPDPSCP